MNYSLDSIGKKIKEQRKALNMTQEQLAEKIDISPTYLAQIENNHRGINVKNLIKIANELNISFDYIMADFTTKQIQSHNSMAEEWMALFQYRSPKQQRLLLNVVKSITDNVFSDQIS